MNADKKLAAIVWLLAAGFTLPAQNFYSREKEAALGAEMAHQVLKQVQPIENDAVREYVDRIGRLLAAQLPDSRLTWTFMPVIDSMSGRTHEPISLPGGYVFVPAAVLIDAHDEAELAGMLAHAMVHVAERHSMQIRNTGSIPLIFMGGWADGDLAADVLLPAALQNAWRANELDADRIAVRTMAAAGYDPGALVRYIDRAQPKIHDARIAAMTEAIQSIAPATYASDNNEFKLVQDEVRRLMPAPKPDEPPRLRRAPSLYHQ